jgi:hypothetical protein
MSTSLIVAGKQVTIYCGILVLIAGVIGALCNTLVFRSLQIFRQSSCAYYLTIMSIASIGHLSFGLSIRIQNALTDTDATGTSLFYCKFRPVTCTISNPIYIAYVGYSLLLILQGYLPITITASFGLLAYRNGQQLAYRPVPLIRRELDKQMTRMVLLQVLVGIFTLLPYTSVFTLTKNTTLANDPVIQAKLQFAITVTVNITYLYA